jgi:hypothetical protein
MRYFFSDEASNVTILGALTYFAYEMGRVLFTHELDAPLLIVGLSTIGLCIRAGVVTVQRILKARGK